MAKSKKKELLFIAEGQTADGKIQSFSVYGKGSSFYVTRITDLYQHLCHPSVKDQDGVKQEITLVFHVIVTSVKYPWELHTRGAEDTDDSQS